MGKAKQVEQADRAVTHTAAAARDTLLMRAVGAVCELADQPPLIGLASGTLIAGAVKRDVRLAETGARMLASHLLATGIKTLLKRSIDRTRPHSVEDGHPYRLEPGESASHHYSSFPSGHTAGAVAVARAVARGYPGAAPYAHGVAAGVGVLQLPIGKHYGTDVLAGAAIGWVSEWAVDRVIAKARTAALWRSAESAPT